MPEQRDNPRIDQFTPNRLLISNQLVPVLEFPSLADADKRKSAPPPRFFERDRPFSLISLLLTFLDRD